MRCRSSSSLCISAVRPRGPQATQTDAEPEGCGMRLNPQPFHAVDMTTDGENDTDGKERERMAASMALSRTSNFAPPPGVLHGASLIREIREIRGRSWERSRLSPPPWLRAPPRPHSLSLPWSGRVPPRPRSALSPQVDCAGPSQRLRSPPGAPSKSFLSAAAESRSIPIHRGSWLPETPERVGADAEVRKRVLRPFQRACVGQTSGLPVGRASGPLRQVGETWPTRADWQEESADRVEEPANCGVPPPPTPSSARRRRGRESWARFTGGGGLTA